MTTNDPNDDAVARYLARDTGEVSVELSAEELAELDELQALLADPTLWAEPPADLEDRVVARISAEAGTADSAVEPTPLRPRTPAAAPDSDTASAPIDLAARRETRAARRASATPPWWRRPGILASAAAAVVAVAVGTVLIIRSIGPSPTFEAALTGTDLLPGASATATMTRTTSGWDIHLDAVGLPRLDSGQFYQAWLRNADGVLVPIGTFNEGADVTLWAGVSPELFPTITITREAADNAQESSGQRVLVGEARPR